MSVTRTVSPTITTLGALALSACLLSACDSSSVGGSGSAGNPAIPSRTPVHSGSCSDPNPSPLSLTFAGVVCIVGRQSVDQPDGSTELKIRVSVTDRDPNAFDITSTDFTVQDSAGHSIQAEGGTARSGSSDCIVQSFSDTGWPVQPGQSFTVPAPFCFNVTSGEKPAALVWQDDVTVAPG